MYLSEEITDSAAVLFLFSCLITYDKNLGLLAAFETLIIFRLSSFQSTAVFKEIVQEEK